MAPPGQDPPDAGAPPAVDAAGSRPDVGAEAADAGAAGADAAPGAAADASALPAGACPALTLEEGASVGGYLGDRYSWSDADCRPRSALLVRNDGPDPAGLYGGYLRRYTYELPSGTRVCDGSSTTHPGFGYTVNHFGSTSSSSRRVAGQHRVVLAGRHHAIHEFTWQQPIDGHPVAVTVHWFFATGRSHPVWAVTYDLTAVPADAVRADTRAPYGDLRWDGGADSEVDGVGWGDHYRFRSTTGPVTMASGWDYSRPNSVPHVLEWAVAADAEMGAVQTQTWQQHDAGGYWFYSSWGRTSTGPMPEDWNWTYQLNQYELPFTTRSKRLAWGANYGAVGQRSYPAYGDAAQLSGYPYQSYSVYVVLDRHSRDPVAAQVSQVEAVQAAALTAEVGAVRLSGPAGVRRPDAASYQPAGWNPIYGTWDVDAAAGRASVRVHAGATPLASPTLVVHGWGGGPPAQVRAGGVARAADVDTFASVDAASGTLWLTLAGELAGDVLVEVE